MSKPRRPRTARRAKERAAEKLAQAREALARISPGGSAEQPLEVPSASVLEARALALGCARCGGELRLEAHEAEARAHDVLRKVRGRCRGCDAVRLVWLRVVVTRPS